LTAKFNPVNGNALVSTEMPGDLNTAIYYQFAVIAAHNLCAI
jgi:hypothetical protein